MNLYASNLFGKTTDYIIEEEISHQEGLVLEGMTYVEGRGYRNNQLLEVYDNNGNNMLTEGVLDGVQTVLDYAGFIPGIDRCVGNQPIMASWLGFFCFVDF